VLQIQHFELITQSSRLVTREYDCATLASVLQKPRFQSIDTLHIECGEGLVKQPKAGRGQEKPREGHSPLLACRQTSCLNIGVTKNP
jgi:hypothetical protein